MAYIIKRVVDEATQVYELVGTGDPATLGAAAGKGSILLRTDGGSGSTFYVKSGTLSTDWTVASPSGGGAGEANTASNVNAGGVGVFKQKTGVNLEFRGVNAASGRISVALDAATNEIDIDAVTGTTATTVCAGNDARLSDARTPTAHAASHQAGGGDAMKLDDLAVPDDNTDLDATTARHGLLPKLPGGTTTFLRADGAFAAPPGGGSIKFVRKAVDQTHGATTYASVSELVFAVEASKNYVAEFDVVFQAAATTTGIGFSATAPAAETSLDITQVIVGTISTNTAGHFGSGHATADDTGAFTTGVGVASTSYVARVTVLLRNGANAGNLQLRVRSEVAANVTIKAGSFGTMYEVTA